MTANRPRRHSKCAFVIFFMLTVVVCSGDGFDWRVTVVPSFPEPPLYESIRGSRSVVLAAARDSGYGELKFSSARSDFQRAKIIAEKMGGEWLKSVKMEIHRDKNRVIESVVITASDDPLLPRITIAPAFYDYFEPLLGAGFYVVIPERQLLVLYPRLAGGIPAKETSALLETYRMATYPVSREVFRSERGGLVAAGILEE